MNIQQFQEFVEEVWIGAGDPRRDGGLCAEIEMGFDMGFVDGDSETTIDNMINVIDELQRELRTVEHALNAVIEEGIIKNDRV